jgi:hypothetical protein
MKVELIDDVLYMDGYDDCLVGHVQICGKPLIALYSVAKLIDRHMQDGMSMDGAIEYIDFNQLGAYVGDQTPGFLIDDEYSDV